MLLHRCPRKEEYLRIYFILEDYDFGWNVIMTIMCDDRLFILHVEDVDI